MGKYSLRTVLVSPFGGQFELDWLLVVVMPEADFMGGIYAEARQTVIICIGILLLSLLFGIVYSARLSKPIQALVLGLATGGRRSATGSRERPIQFPIIFRPPGLPEAGHVIEIRRRPRRATRPSISIHPQSGQS